MSVRPPCASEAFVRHMREKWGDGVLVYNSRNADEVVWFTTRKLNPFVRYTEGRVVVHSVHGSSWSPLSPGSGWARVEIVPAGQTSKCGKRLVDLLAGFGGE